MVNNKYERRRKGYFKFIKRLKNFRLDKSMLSRDNNHNVYALKTTGTPCSCAMCSPGKVEPKTKYKKPKHKNRQFDE